MRLSIDVDLCVVASDAGWTRWLEEVTSGSMPLICLKDCIDRKLDYNLANYYSKHLNQLGIDGMDYWRQKDLYDHMTPRSDAVRAIRQLEKDGHEYFFVSAIKGDHSKSKWNFLKRHFPAMLGYVATKEKHLVQCDVMIDDRAEILSKFSPGTYKVLLHTPYSQVGKDGVDYREVLKEQDNVAIVGSWEGIPKMINNYDCWLPYGNGDPRQPF